MEKYIVFGFSGRKYFAVSNGGMQKDMDTRLLSRLGDYVLAYAAPASIPDDGMIRNCMSQVAPPLSWARRNSSLL